jgi:PAS domain S-box-containing protein
MAFPSGSNQNPSSLWFTERRNITLLVLAAFLLLSGTAYFLSRAHFRDATEQALEQDRATTNLLSIILGDHFQNSIRIMESHTHRPVLLQAVREKDAGKAKERLVALMKDLPNAEDIFITDRQGKLWTHYPPAPELLGKSFADQDWYKGVQKGWKPYVSDVFHMTDENKGPVVNVGIPFFDDRKEVVGILVSTQRMVNMDEIIQLLPLDPDAATSIIDGKGQIAYSNRPAYGKKIISYPFYDLIRQAQIEKKQSIAVDDPYLDNRKRYISFASIASLGWFVSTGRDSRDMLLSEKMYYFQTAAIFILLFLLTTMFLIYFKKQVTMQQLRDQLQAEEAIRETRDYLESLIKYANAPIIVWNPSAVITRFNHAFEKLTGRDASEVMGKKLDLLFPEESREESLHLIDQTLKGERLESIEIPIVNKDGRVHTVLWNSANLLSPDRQNVISTIAQGQDITERKRAEKALLEYRDHLEDLVRERTQDLEQANLHLQELDTLKAMFIASMSHELRTPLNSIIGFTGIILMGMSGEISPIQKKQLTMVKNSANHLLALINDVIDVSKIEAGKTEVSIEDFDLSDLIREVKESFAIAASEKQLKLELSMDGGIRVTSDRRRVRQIVVNLVGNAVKFTKTGRVAILVSVTGKGVDVKVRDTGIGMSREGMGRLFQAFSRIQVKDQPIIEGTGLGLYLSQKIAVILGGEITAESEIGRGSEFTLRLPWKYREGVT